MLANTLVSLDRMTIPHDVEVRIVIVDNDAARSAHMVVETFKETSRHPVEYVNEPRKGISFARNAALAIRRGDYLAFLDDDEIADAAWLEQMHKCAVDYAADVVFGPVLSILPENVPEWIRRGAFFERPRDVTGTSRPCGATRSVMFRTKVLDAAGRAFDETFSLTGGEDTEFTYYLGRNGARMIWCDEALAWETIPPSRANFWWLLKRQYQVGQAYGRVMRIHRPLRYFVWLLRRTADLAVSIPAIVLKWPRGTHRAMDALFSAVRNVGHLSTLAGCRYNAYE